MNFNSASDDVHVIDVKTLAINFLVYDENRTFQGRMSGSDDLCFFGSIVELVEDRRKINKSKWTEDDRKLLSLF